MSLNFGYYCPTLKVDFDKTKHLSEPSIRRRRIEREKLIALEREEEERERMAQELEEQRLEEERKQKLEEKRSKLERQKQREEKRKQRFLAEMKEKENQALKDKIAVEERKLLIAQRKLESIRLLDELFERIKNTSEEQNISDKEEAVAPEINQMDENQETEEDKDKLQEMELRRRLIHRYKNLHKLELEKQRERLQMMVEGKDPASSQLSERESSSDSGSSSQISTERKPSVCGSSNHCSCCSKSHSTHHAQMSKEKTGNKWKEKKSSTKECKDYQKWLQDKQYHDNHQFYPYSERMEYYPHQRYRYNPRFAQDFHGRRLNQRRRGFYPYRRGDRGNFSQARSQEYYEDINEEYYKYFRKLAKQNMQSHSNDSSSYSESRSKSGSRSSFTTPKDRSKLKAESKSKKISLKTSRSKSDETKPDVMQEKDLCGHLSQLNSRSRSRSSSKIREDGSKLRFESTSKDASSRPSSPRSRKSKMKTKLHKSKRKSVSRSRSRSTSRSFSTSWSFSSLRSNSWTQVDRAEHNGQIAPVGNNDEKNVSQQLKRRKHHKKHKKHKRKTKSKN